jgi:hypothetical protein
MVFLLFILISTSGLWHVKLIVIYRCEYFTIYSTLFFTLVFVSSVLYKTILIKRLFKILPNSFTLLYRMKVHKIQTSCQAQCINPLTPELNPSAQRCLTRFFTCDFASWTVHFIDICVKTNKYTNYSFSLLIMYGSSYMFRHYIAIFRERS